MTEPAAPGSRDHSQSSPPRGLWNWIDERTGIKALLREQLDEPIPGGARYAYIFGSGLLFIFLSQVITGTFLALYYVPSADHAHTTVAYITKVVASGAFLRSLHVYGASAMVIIVLLHVGQTFLYGSYKGRREMLWLSGAVLFALVLGMAFTGYLLPWDQKAYFATAVGTNVPAEIPVVGNAIKEIMRGGSELGTLTISRFFVAHVFFIPGLMLLFIAGHLMLFRTAGPAGPASENPLHPTLPTQTFYPRQLLMDLSLALVLIVVLGALSYFVPAALGPEANPADTQFLPRPEWYYRSLFQWLKLWHGGGVVIGIGVIPLIVVVLFVGVPFFDRKLERRFWRRPVSVGIFALVFGGLIALEALSYYDDSHNAAVASQLALQEKQAADFMREPFKPEVEGAAAAEAAPPATPQGAVATEVPSLEAAIPASPRLGVSRRSRGGRPGSPVGATAASETARASETVSAIRTEGAARGAAAGEAAQGKKIFESHSCNACHGEVGAGTPIAPKLAGIGHTYTPQQLLDLFNHPTAKMDAGNMPHFQFTLDDTSALIAYLGGQP